MKPTDLFTYGLIPEFTGRLPIIARFDALTRAMLVRIMTEPRNAIYPQFRDIFKGEGVELDVEPQVFEQIAELAIEYKTGARSLRGLFEELITPILYDVPDDQGRSARSSCRRCSARRSTCASEPPRSVTDAAATRLPRCAGGRRLTPVLSDDANVGGGERRAQLVDVRPPGGLDDAHDAHRRQVRARRTRGRGRSP